MDDNKNFDAMISGIVSVVLSLYPIIFRAFDNSLYHFFFY